MSEANRMSYKKVILALLTFVFAIAITGCSLPSFSQEGPEIQEGDEVVGAVEDVINLEQGWTEDTQESFYFTPQGSQIMPYSWFLALEQPSSQSLFRSDKNINALRYLPAKPTKMNPDGLPVGFVKDIGSNDTEFLGLTCAACHTTQISYQGTNMRIDGGPTLGDFEGFNNTLVDALSETYQNPEKFDRFAKKVLGEQADLGALSNLRQALLEQTEILANRNLINVSSPEQPHYGFARLDAIGAIFNQVMVTFNDLPANDRPSDAPVSYPFLWGTDQSDVVQWPGFAPNGPADLGTLTRNGGEVLGVYGKIDIPEEKLIKAYESSLEVENLGLLESWVADLRSPAWPAEYLPPVDPEKAARGKLHYDQYCLQCHQVIAREDQGKAYNAVLTPLSDVRTDPTELHNLNRLLAAGKFEDRKELVFGGPEINTPTTGLNPLINSVVGALLDQPLQTVKAAAIEISSSEKNEKVDDEITFNNEDAALSEIKDNLGKYEELLEALPSHRVGNDSTSIGDETTSTEDDTTATEDKTTSTEDETISTGGLVYKARPLNGIWATAPYLHNGSVPNLYELLLVQEERSGSFYVGNRELDPEKVGLVSTVEKTDIPLFKFDTSLKGNSNEGHEYGAKELNDEQKWEIVEYLKTL